MRVKRVRDVADVDAEDQRLCAQREHRRGDHERDRQPSTLLVDEPRETRVIAGLKRQRAAGDEPGDAGHRVQRQHERVARQDLEYVELIAHLERRAPE